MNNMSEEEYEEFVNNVDGNYRAMRRPYREILYDLRRKIPPSKVETKEHGNADYVPWHITQKFLHMYAPGAEFEIVNTEVFEDIKKDGSKDKVVYMVGKLTIPAEEGDITQYASATEANEDAYRSSPFESAESRVFRRCCARHGFALDLWDGGYSG